ncbi:MAG: hypothetical protein HWN81_11445 [Candidatus Lokiarchaeota archaeon]|nr:hypothetical protein [Candidatus Lokiarchaeota archaeon]
MGKGGAVLGLIGILLGAGGLGFAFIIWNTQNNIQSQIIGLTPQNIWYRYYDDTFDVDSPLTYMPIPNMSLSIDLTTQTSIYLLFTCTALITGNLGRSDVIIYYYVDETIISYPVARVGGFAGNYSSYFHSVSLQHMIVGWSVGSHNISMFARSTVDTNDLQYCRLIVQSFPV